MKNFHLDRGSTATMAFFGRNVQKKNNTSFTFGKWLNANFEDKMKDKVKNLQLIIILRSFFPYIPEMFCGFSVYCTSRERLSWNRYFPVKWYNNNIIHNKNNNDDNNKNNIYCN